MIGYSWFEGEICQTNYGVKVLWTLLKVFVKKFSSREVIDAHLARIDVVNPKVNALIHVMAEEARASADAADKALAQGGPIGPLHGVPYTVKINIDVAGQATTQGITALAEAIPPLMRRPLSA